MKKKATKKKEETEKKAGRPRIYEGKTRSLSAQVPVDHYKRLKIILDYELNKLKIKP